MDDDGSAEVTSMDLKAQVRASRAEVAAFSAIDAELARLQEKISSGETSATAVEQTLSSIKKHETRIFHSLNRVDRAIDKNIPEQPLLETPKPLSVSAEDPSVLAALDRAVLWNYVRDGRISDLKKLEPFATLIAESPNLESDLGDAQKLYAELDSWLLKPADEALAWPHRSTELAGHLLRAGAEELNLADAPSKLLWLGRQIKNGRLPEDSIRENVQRLSVELLLNVSPSNEATEKPLKKTLSQLARQRFSDEFCRLHDLPRESLLWTTIRIAELALPQMLRAERVRVRPRELLDSDENGEMFAEIDLPKDLQFHPVFVCPVTKTHLSSRNGSSLLLPCGHILSETAASSLPSHDERIRCPYCPGLARFSELRKVNFI